jgi:uncharacterized membrane protein YbhN (UPF0104 family)
MTQTPEPGQRQRQPQQVVILARRLVGVGVGVAVAAGAVSHRHQLTAAARLVGHLSWGWLVPALSLQAASLATYAALQRRLLAAGNGSISTADMAKIVLAANALAGSLPGGAAWSATWSWKQLRERGVNRRLATWVVLVAGALSSVALFLLVVVGSELAGDGGPVASLRWLGRILTALAVAGCVVVVARVRLSRPSATPNALQRLIERLAVVRPSPTTWTAAFTLAAANWLLDAACLIACIAALGAPVPWKGILVAYGLTQIAGAFPITPAGLGVIDAGLAALLVAYGMQAPAAIAAVVVYRALTLWVLVPVGWGLWWNIRTQQNSPPTEITSVSQPVAQVTAA